MLAVLLSLQVSLLYSIPPPPSCSQLVPSFRSRGVAPSDIPSTPLSGMFQTIKCKMLDLFMNLSIIIIKPLKRTWPGPKTGHLQGKNLQRT